MQTNVPRANSPLLAQIAAITQDRALQARLERHGLQAVNVCWEDTSRTKGSCVGDNITDMTLQVNNGNTTRASNHVLMPAVRPPNFSDRTVDLPIDTIRVTVGNESAGAPLRHVSLREYLENASKYTGNERVQSLYRERDAVAIASAQACILPLSTGEVSFNVCAYNYQSRDDDPAVLMLVCSAQGTSAQVLDAGTSALYFNDAGVARDFVAKDVADVRGTGGGPVTSAQQLSAAERDANLLYVVQVPLKHKTRPPAQYYGDAYACCFSTASNEGVSIKSARGMGYAAVSKGRESYGEYRGTRGLALERDERYPIRIVLQTYLVTDSAAIADSMLDELAQRVTSLFSHGHSMSSLVTEQTRRATETAPSVAPPSGFSSF